MYKHRIPREDELSHVSVWLHGVSVVHDVHCVHGASDTYEGYELYYGLFEYPEEQSIKTGNINSVFRSFTINKRLVHTHLSRCNAI